MDRIRDSGPVRHNWRRIRTDYEVLNGELAEIDRHTQQSSSVQGQRQAICTKINVLQRVAHKWRERVPWNTDGLTEEQRFLLAKHYLVVDRVADGERILDTADPRTATQPSSQTQSS